MEAGMCLTRGDCQDVFNDHGDPRNITMTTLQTAANGASITVPEALSNIQKGVSRALRGMTDWTGDQQGGSSLVLGSYAEGPQLSSAPPPPSPGEKSPGS
jgi:N-acetylglucosamine-6-phosphate deacetylase